MKRVTLLKPHTHDGVAHASGVTLNVPDVAARWLLDHRIAVPARNAVTVPAAEPAAEPDPQTPAPPIADSPSGDKP